MIRLASLSSTTPRAICRCISQRSSARFLQRSFLSRRFKSSSAAAELDIEEADSSGKVDAVTSAEIRRLKHIRNVGIFAHVDAGKTTVTERFLALAGIVKRAGSVDDGNTVTDYLPAERERGITIQSAAISFEWGWHNNRTGDDFEVNENVKISLIDTPGHVDFSVEVNRSVAVLDGAVLVVDAVAGVQAQTETVWRAMTRPSLNNHDTSDTASIASYQDHAHEPLPCLALINKMDKEGCHFGNAIKSLRHKLSGANPIPTQVPIFRTSSKSTSSKLFGNRSIIAIPIEDVATASGEFVGVVDLIHMRAIIWPDLPMNSGVANVENCVPEVISLLSPVSHEPVDETCQVTKDAIEARAEFIEALAECDAKMEELYLNEEEPSNAELRAALRRATLSQRALPVMASAALRGKGIEPVLDAIADLLPSPLDRMAPSLTVLDDGTQSRGKQPKKKDSVPAVDNKITIGHPLHPSLLALAFKVVHMKGRGGSGDGRVVFARVYSGQLKDRDVVRVISPPSPGEAAEKPKAERVGGMLELAGGRFDNLENGVCKSGDVCALVGLKSVVTGDTIVLGPERSSKKKKQKSAVYYLGGVTSPKPVLTVRLEAESTEHQARLSEALTLLAIEDPSLVVQETESATLLSGLGELHIEVILDRLHREFGVQAVAGAPSVEYRETITDTMETAGLLEYDRTIGGTRLQAAVHLVLKPTWSVGESACVMLSDPSVTVGEKAREFMGVDLEKPEDDLMVKSDVFRSLVEACRGALKRGPLGPYAMTNVKCHVVDIDAEEGLAGLQAMPGALRAAAAHAISTTLAENRTLCSVLEPMMSLEVTVPNEMVGAVLSDFTSRRGTVGDVFTGESDGSVQMKALVHGDVPLVEILGYANSLRSLTAGEAAFTAEYKGHSPFSGPVA